MEDMVMKQQQLISGVLLAALVGFELFNFDTTRYALSSLFGETSFLALPWATILAVAFCGIDFAGLARLFVEAGGERHAPDLRHPESIYLWGAWFLAAGMNAAMTWWAVSLTLLQHDFGNEVLSHAQILRFVPIFMAVLVWLTRILIIGAFSVASSSLLRDWSARQRTAPDDVPVLIRGASAAGGRRTTVPGSLARVLGAAPAVQASPARPSSVDKGYVEGDFEVEPEFYEEELPPVPARPMAPPVRPATPPVRPATPPARPAASPTRPVAPPARPAIRPAPKPAPAASSDGSPVSPPPAPAAGRAPVPTPFGLPRPSARNGNGHGTSEESTAE
jgi:hypothetical protein